MKTIILYLLLFPAMALSQVDPVVIHLRHIGSVKPPLPSSSYITEAYVGMWEPSFTSGDGGHIPIKCFDYGLWNRFIVFNVRPDSANDSLTTSYPSLLTATNMQTWQDSVHAYGNKLICCIGVNGQDFRGWLGYQRGATSVPDTLHVIMGKLANFLTAYHFDGFDIDWEGQASSDTTYWKMLIDSLTSNFSNISATGQEGSMYSEYASESSKLTMINIMTYDLTSYASPGWNSWFNFPVYSGTEKNALGNPNASIATVTANFVAAGCPKLKLAIASSPIGNLWVEDTNTVMMNYNNTAYTDAGPDSFNLSWQFSWSSNSSIWLTYAPGVSGDIAWYNPSGTGLFQKYLPAAYPVYNSDTVVANGFDGYVHSHWDSTHEASWMSHDSTDSMTTWYMAFEGLQDMQSKIRYVADSSLGGYFIYELGEGYNYTNPPSGYMPYQEYIRQQIIDIWKQTP